MFQSTDPSEYKLPPVPPSRSRRRKLTLPTVINRFGLHGLAGELTRDGRDPMTLQVLKEVRFLPRKVKAHVCENGNVLKPQASIPPNTNPPGQNHELSFGQLGLSTQDYSPLKLKRVFGRSTHPGNSVFNLTGCHKSHIVYAASNVLVFFDYYTNSQSVLQGHHSVIVSMAKDDDFKYIATADSEYENNPPTTIIWNARTGFPIYTFPVLFGNPEVHCSEIVAIAFVGGLNCIGILQFVRQNNDNSTKNEGNDHRGDEKSHPTKPRRRQMVSIWRFGHSNTDPNMETMLELPCRTNRRFQHKMLFSTENPFHFVTYSHNGYHIMFHTWVRRESRISTYVPRGHLGSTKTIGFLLAALWFENSLLIATARGYIVEFKAQIPLGLDELPDPHLNVKDFRRFIKIEEGLPLTAIVAHKGFIVLGDAQGGVRFLDTRFRILRWTTTRNDNPVSSIGFHLTDHQPPWKFEMKATYSKGGHDHNTFHREGNSTVYDYTFGGGKYRPVSETTFERKPLHQPEECLDMVVGYENGSVAYFHVAEEKFDTILPETLSSRMNFLDVSPTTTHLVICAEDSRIQLFDYNTFTLTLSKKLFAKSVLVTCVRFHPSGAFLVLGTDHGTLYFRSTFTMKILNSPLHVSKGRILRVEFSSCGTYAGVHDDLNTVILCYFHRELQRWTLKGKHRSHYEPIVDICFFNDVQYKAQRFFSLGKDRRVVEYHIEISTASTGLQIMTVTLLDNIPTSMTFADGFFNHGPILHIATTNNKIRMFDQNELKIRRTCQGPDYGSAITRMILISPEATMGSEAEFVLTIMENKIGLMKSPIDGNPFKHMGIYAHAAPIRNVGVGGGGKNVFTLCDGQGAVFMWTPNIFALENSELTGGAGIVPFKRYLDANLPPGISVVEDIENIFYHLMLKRAKDQGDFLKMSLTILVDEIPIVMRTCGYFPTEQEVDQILDEAKFLQGIKYGTNHNEISFDDFLILYANHKDGGIAKEEVTRAFNILGEQNAAEEICIPREKFVSMITTKGEKLLNLDLHYFLPNFYSDAASKESIPVQEVVEPGHLREKSTHSSIPQSGKSDGSIPEDNNSAASSESSHSADGPVVVDERETSKVFGSLGSTEESEELLEDGTFQPVKRMPRDITVDFFLEHILPDDPHMPFKLLRDDVLDDIYDLNRTSDEHETEGTIALLLNRWRERKEWRFVKEMFDKLKEAPIERRLEVVVELDNLYRTGKFRGNEQGNEGTPPKTLKPEEETEISDSEIHPPLPHPSSGILKASRRESAHEDEVEISLAEAKKRSAAVVEFLGETSEEDGEFDDEIHFSLSGSQYFVPYSHIMPWDVSTSNEQEEIGIGIDGIETEVDEDEEEEPILEEDHDDETRQMTPPLTNTTDMDESEIETEAEVIGERESDISI